MGNTDDTALSQLAAHQHKYSTAIHQARCAGPAVFQRWFNRESARDVPQCVVRGHWDFAMHILTPAVCRVLCCPEEKVALEIGYGGGRLLNAACSYFQKAIGIDIHNEQEMAAQFLRSQNKTNFRLLKTDGATIEAAAASIDFVYSFIVLQHLPSFAALVSYLHEVRRCLKPGGVAQLYFGKFARLHPVYQAWYWRQGYRETPHVPANHISLVVRPGKVKAVCREIGLQVVAAGTSFFHVPDGYPKKSGGQSYVTLLKPAAQAAASR